MLAAQVPLDELFVDFEAHVESSDGEGELIVSEKGGQLELLRYDHDPHQGGRIL